MRDLRPDYADALQEVLRLHRPGAVLRHPVTYEIPGIWYMHAEVPGLGTTTLRIPQIVVDQVPLPITLAALETLPGLVGTFTSPTVTLEPFEGGVQLRLDDSPAS